MIIIAYPVGIASGGKVRGTGTQPMSTITLENVSKYYKNKRRSGAGNRYEVGVENINLTIEQGEFVFITGSSGAGKSTLLGLISGRLKPCLLYTSQGRGAFPLPVPIPQAPPKRTPERP